jgi:hypothetical protein
MATNILSLPFVTIQFENGTNEDWIDSLLFLVPDGSNNIDQYPQLDLRGIDFEMELRRSATDREVILNASTKDGTLMIGDYPNYGWFIIQVPVTKIEQRQASQYVGDVVASDSAFTRRCMYFTLNLVEGVTRGQTAALLHPDVVGGIALHQPQEHVAVVKLIQGVKQ